jgi:hypothetical protein
MSIRTSTKNLVWEAISSGFTKARAEKELEMEKAFHPNHYVRMKRYAVGNWGIIIAKKPHGGRNRTVGVPLSAVRGGR